MSKHSSDIIDEIILSVTKNEEILNKRDFQKLCNEIYSVHKTIKPIPNIAFIERYHEMVSDARITPSARVEKIFRKRGVRNQSWIAVISLLTKFWWCPGKCIFCPNFPWLPRSYIPDEPAVMRAEMNEFDPIKQVFNRLRWLRITGHCIDKCDVRIIGGTWSVYPKLYQELFIRAIYDAHTLYEELEPFIEATSTGTDKFAEFKIKKGFEMRESKTLEEAKERNMHARSRVVGIQIETRPDWINIDEIKRLRSYDVTRVEIGYQTTIDEINELNKRWHGNKESIEATKMLKDAWFKVCAHMMPNLLGSTPDLDRNSLAEIFNNSDYRPDELKIYPMMVTDKSELTEIWRKGGFRAYDDETLIPLMADLLERVPPYVRLNRVYRDIPAHQILHGSHLANLRQISEELLRSRGGKVVDTASREVKGKNFTIENLGLVTREYDASEGKDYLITFEEKWNSKSHKYGYTVEPKDAPDDATLYSLLRLRIPSQYYSKQKHFLPILEWAAIIREIHTFWEQVAIGEEDESAIQHRWFGKKMVLEAEKIVQEKYPDIKKIAVIAWVGVRPYFEKLGYTLEEGYMIKYL
jgi:elongator complex protein 3